MAEDAFVGFLEDFFHQVALGAKYQAGILDDSIQTVREFVPIVRPERFKGEARFRLAEIVALICSYEPHELDHGSLRLEAPSEGDFLPSVWNLIENSEFRSMVSISGKLGYLKHPLIGLKRLQRAIQTFFSREDAKRLLSLAKTTAECAGAGNSASTIEKVLEGVATLKANAFRPPFVGIASTHLGIYRRALADAYPEATPPPGSIMLFEQSRAGRVSHSWLNVGEERKLDLEAADRHRRSADFKRAKAVQERFLL